VPESNPPIELRGLGIAELERLAGERKLPPVERWDPPFCGHSGMRITRDGTWWHQGSPINRPAMVRLFSTVLRREADGRHMLVTPVEKLEIDVEATAFRAVEMTCEGEGHDQRIAVRLDSGDVLLLGPQHALTIAGSAADPSPRIAVRHGLEAELSRPIYYELAEVALAGNGEPAGIWSDGAFFPLEPTE
jgi:hypothetical protein